MANLTGTSGNDTLIGDTAGDIIDALGGDDFVGVGDVLLGEADLGVDIGALDLAAALEARVELRERHARGFAPVVGSGDGEAVALGDDDDVEGFLDARQMLVMRAAKQAHERIVLELER